MHICLTQPFDLLGKPFLNPDGTPAVYNPPDSQQPIRSQTQLQGSSSQQQQQQQVAHTQPEDLLSLMYIPVSVCVFISVSIRVCLSGGSVLICVLHSSADVACCSLTAILHSTYRCIAG